MGRVALSEGKIIAMWRRLRIRALLIGMALSCFAYLQPISHEPHSALKADLHCGRDAIGPLSGFLHLPL